MEEELQYLMNTFRSASKRLGYVDRADQRIHELNIYPVYLKALLDRKLIKIENDKIYVVEE